MADHTCIRNSWRGYAAFTVNDKGQVSCKASSTLFPWDWEDYCQWSWDFSTCERRKYEFPLVDTRFTNTAQYDAFLLSVQIQLRPKTTPPTKSPMPVSPKPSPLTESPQPPTTPTTAIPVPPTSTPSPITTLPTTDLTTTTSPNDDTTLSPTTTSTTPITTPEETPIPSTTSQSVDPIVNVNVIMPPGSLATVDWTCVTQASIFTPVRLNGATGKLECLALRTSDQCHILESSTECVEWMGNYITCAVDNSCVDVRVMTFNRQTTPDMPSISPNTLIDGLPSSNMTNVEGQAQNASVNPINSILMGVLIAAAFVAGVVGIILWRRRRRNDFNDSMMMLTDAGPLYITEKGTIPVMGYHQSPEAMISPATSHLRSTASSLPRPTIGGQLDMGELSLWRLDEGKLSTSRILSMGTSGVVELGFYKGTPVAVKKLRAETSMDGVQVFIDEIKLMTKLDSPYILSIVGCVWNRPKDIELIVEYMEAGDLRNYLLQTPRSVFTWDLKRSCLHNITQGLLYLHSMEIIHRDLKSRNVLLSKQLNAKLTDFGVSREITTETMTHGIGSFRWTAPEILEGKRYTEAADIYSLGMIAWELDTHDAPYTAQQTAQKLSDVLLMTKIRKGQLEPQFTPTCPNDVSTIVLQCISMDPLDRPTALDLSVIV